MKAVILAGGLGTRLGYETELKPKPMVPIGGRPILWHIMMQYSAAGVRDFVIALGYRGDVIKKYLLEFRALQSDLTIDMRSGEAKPHRNGSCPEWNVQLIDTGENTAKGGRLRRVAPYVGHERFFLAWGDGVSDLDLRELLRFHLAHGKLATLTAVRPPRDSVTWTSTAIGSPCFRKRYKPRKAGSTAECSCSNPKCSITSIPTRWNGKRNHWSDWRKMAS